MQSAIKPPEEEKIFPSIQFKMPSPEDRKKALDKFKLPAAVAPYFAGISTFWRPVPEPTADDWLYSQSEDGQTFNMYSFMLQSHKINAYEHRGTRKFIYILPLDKDLDGEFLARCKLYIEAFFLGAKVKQSKLAPIEKDKDIHSRKKDGKVQYHAMDFINKYKARVPADAYCLIAITLQDIYPGQKWNFVFGMASLNERVGLFSLARYHPSFFHESPDLSQKEIGQLIQFRACKVMTHEISHMFGIKHCIYYHCAMCGSMHAEEAARRPMHLCPICVRKLQLNLKFDYVKRYKALLKAIVSLDNKHFQEEAQWLSERVEFLEARLKK